MPRPTAGAPAFGGKWSSLKPPLTPWIADVIAAQGFENMTPVQAGTIPRAVKNQDCVVEAVTGSGKTLAFVVPVLERMVRNEHKYRKGEVAAVVIAPTRELASQIHQVFHMFLSTLVPPPPSEDGEGDVDPDAPPPLGEYTLPTLVTRGSETPYDDFFNRSSNILIGTPGRLASFLLAPRGLNAVNVSNLDCLVLDEADRLLSAPDHRREVERIMRHLPKQRRTHLFSATMTDAVEDLVGIGLRNPVRIVVNLKDKRAAEGTQERRVPMGLQNTYLVSGAAEKTLQLIRVLRREATEFEAAKMIVYFSTCAAVDYFYRILAKLPELENFHLVSLHGDLPPRVRETALNGFTSHPSSHLSPSILLCTDVAARGVDFSDIDAVVQYDAPTDPKTFSHRVGRTARAGRAGRAVLLLSRGREEEYVNFLSVRKIPLVRTRYLTAQLEEVDSPVPTPESPLDPDAASLLDEMRAIVLTDRDLADRGAKALVSSVKAYMKHEASFIFRPAELDYGALGTAFGLLRLPSMPEVRKWRQKVDKLEKERKGLEGKEGVEAEANGTDKGKPQPKAETKPETQNGTSKKEAAAPEDYPVVWTDATLDWQTYAYASKQRESARQQTLAEKAARQADPATREEDDAARERARKKRKLAAEARSAWSEQKERKVRKDERREKRDRKKQAVWDAKVASGEVEGLRSPELRASKVGKKRKEVEMDSEDEEDYRLLKREVKGERAARKAEREGAAKETVGMFDDLD